MLKGPVVCPREGRCMLGGGDFEYVKIYLNVLFGILLFGILEYNRKYACMEVCMEELGL